MQTEWQICFALFGSDETKLSESSFLSFSFFSFLSIWLHEIATCKGHASCLDLCLGQRHSR